MRAIMQLATKFWNLVTFLGDEINDINDITVSEYEDGYDHGYVAGLTADDDPTI